MENDRIYALKMIRAVDRYVESAKTETEIIEYVQKRDVNDEHHIVRLFETFNFG